MTSDAFRLSGRARRRPKTAARLRVNDTTSHERSTATRLLQVALLALALGITLASLRLCRPMQQPPHETIPDQGLLQRRAGGGRGRRTHGRPRQSPFATRMRQHQQRLETWEEEDEEEEA